MIVKKHETDSFNEKDSAEKFVELYKNYYKTSNSDILMRDIQYFLSFLLYLKDNETFLLGPFSLTKLDQNLIFIDHDESSNDALVELVNKQIVSFKGIFQSDST